MRGADENSRTTEEVGVENEFSPKLESLAPPGTRVVVGSPWVA